MQSSSRPLIFPVKLLQFAPAAEYSIASIARMGKPNPKHFIQVARFTMNGYHFVSTPELGAVLYTTKQRHLTFSGVWWRLSVWHFPQTHDNFINGQSTDICYRHHHHHITIASTAVAARTERNREWGDSYLQWMSLSVIAFPAKADINSWRRGGMVWPFRKSIYVPPFSHEHKFIQEQSIRLHRLGGVSVWLQIKFTVVFSAASFILLLGLCFSGIDVLWLLANFNA